MKALYIWVANVDLECFNVIISSIISKAGASCTSLSSVAVNVCSSPQLVRNPTEMR